MRFSGLKQLAISMGAFAAVMLLLESGGLYDWAQRLELGPERSFALPLCTAVHRLLSPLRLERGRERTLVALAHIGWSDDPVALAAVASDTALPMATAEHQLPPVIEADGKIDAIAPTASKPAPHLSAAALSLEAPPLFTKLPALPDAAPGVTTAPITVGLAGDSMMAVGLSAAIQHSASRYPNLTFVNLFKSGTGLARPEIFNWQFEYPAMLRQVKPDFVIVAMGANDGQGFVANGVTYAFGTAGWQSIYQQRVESFLRLLEASGTTVIWVGLPPMKDATFGNRMDQINRIDYACVMASPHAFWFSTAGIVGDEHGAFRDFGEVRSRMERLRQNDGIHLTDDGAEPIAAKLLPWLAAQKIPAIANDDREVIPDPKN